MSATMDQTTVDYRQHFPQAFEQLQQVHVHIQASGLDHELGHLIMLRASQINGCGFCVKMHTREAREGGITNHRLDHLAAWRQVEDYTASERAALAWLEALTMLDPKTDYQPLRLELLEHFPEQQVASLTVLCAMINLWNRIQISNH